ncbi:hypothetical protein JCM10295v2_002372 [Rhodotorula toruloides]
MPAGRFPVANAPGWKSFAINIVRYSWLNVLLVFIPVSWICRFTHQSPTVTFIMSFIGALRHVSSDSIIPLASLLGFATEDLAIRVGETVGGLLNATFGNAVELIIAVLALVRGALQIVHASMIGSILSNCLLAFRRMCYFAGELKRHEMSYGVRSAQININLLGLAVTAIVIPVAVHHFSMPRKPKVSTRPTASCGRMLTSTLPRLAQTLQTSRTKLRALAWRQATWNLSRLRKATSSTTSRSSSLSNSELEHHTPKMLGRVAVLLLVVVTVFAGVTAEWLVSSVEGLVETGNVSEQFVALILLPLVGNASAHVAASPSCVLQYFTLVLVVSIVGVNWAIADGKTNWLEGLVLMVIYIIIALVFWYYDPGTPLR